MKGYIQNIETLTIDNQNFREVLFTTPHSQLVLMALLPGEDIGMEVHTVDQFFRIESGSGMAILDDAPTAISDGSAIVVPAGVHHNIVNNGLEPMKLYTIYSPPNHRDGVVHKTKIDAEVDHEHFDGKTTEAVQDLEFV